MKSNNCCLSIVDLQMVVKSSQCSLLLIRTCNSRNSMTTGRSYFILDLYLSPHMSCHYHPSSPSPLPLLSTGAAYLDFPGDLLQATVPEEEVEWCRPLPPPPRALADPTQVMTAAKLLGQAVRPLVIVGKGQLGSSRLLGG